MKKTLSLSFVLLAMVTLGLGTHVFAEGLDLSADVQTSVHSDGNGNQESQGRSHSGSRKPGIIGTVTAINGSTISATGMNNTAYTIDATSATISKGLGKKSTTLTISNIAVGDRIMAQGTLTGNSLVATKIIDTGIAGTERQDANHVSGKVSAISGNTITVTERDNSTYTVNASSATVTKGFGANATASSVGAIAVGDFISVTSLSTISGTSVTASAITDMGTRMMEGGMMNNGNHLFGIISAVNGSNFTISMRAPGDESSSKTLTAPNFVTTSSTIVTNAGQASSVASLAVGQTIVADGTLNTATNTFTATTVRIINASANGNENRLQNSASVKHGFFQGMGNFFRGIFK